MNIKEINGSILNNSKMICLDKRKLMRNIFIWFITAIFISPAGLFAQKDNLHFERLGLEESLSQATVTCIFQDKQGFMWFGTQDGLNKFDGYNFTIYRHNPDDSASLSDNYIRSVYEDSWGYLWIGTNDGLNKLDRKTEKFTRCLNQAGNPQSLSNNSILSILEDSGGSLWIGTDKGGLNKLVQKDNTESNSKQVKFIRYQNQPDNSQSISDNSIRSIFEDSGGRLWIGTDRGLNKLVLRNIEGSNKTTNKFTRYQSQEDNPKSISDNYIKSIFEDSEGNLWLGTRGGLNKLDIEEEKFVHYRKKDGLPKEVINGIMGDDKGNLWLSTNKGISKFNSQTETFTNYNKKDGLQNNEFNVGVFHQGGSGMIYFGGVNGIIEFYPDSIKENTFAPPVVITDFLLFNKSVSVNDTTVLKENINFTKEIILDYTDYIFTFEFSALNYRQPEKNQFAYKLENFNEEWINTDYKNRRATYTNLSPGDYIFRVKASNDDGYWNEEGTSVKVTILSPWWKTTPVRLFIIILFISGLLGVHRFRVRVMAKQNLELGQQIARKTIDLIESRERTEAANEAKSIFLANMSHELRTPLNGILGYAQILIRNTELLDSQKKGINVILTSGRHLLNLINDLLDLTKIEARKIVLDESDLVLSRFLEDIVSIIQIRTQRKEIPFFYKFSPDLPKYIHADAKRLNQVLLNLLSNGIKFTDNGNVTFEVFPIDSNKGRGKRTKSDKIRFKVSDTGIGIPEDKLEDIFSAFTQIDHSDRTGDGTGLGLTICRQITQMMGSEIHVESTINKGSVFWFDLKFREISEAENPKKISTFNISGYKGDRKNILVVEDNKASRTFMVDLFSSLDFKVHEAVNGREAIDFAVKIKPDLIFMDLVMPEINGLEAIRRIKELPDLNHIKIIITSASATTQMKKDSLESGANDFLQKPVQVEELFGRTAFHLNLTWVHGKKQRPFSKPIMRKETIIFPSKEILEKLCDYAKQYEYQGLYEQLEIIKKESDHFFPFTEKIRQLAEDYKMDEIIEMLKNK